MKSVVVTGVSTGIGWGCAKVLVASGFRVFGSVRNTADAGRLAKELGPNCCPLLFDVTDEAAVRAAARQVEAALEPGEALAGLVNNAGVAVPGPLLALAATELERQLAVNLVGPLIVTQAFAPLLGAGERRSPPGRIVMMSSVGGKNAAPFLGAYSASKFGLEGMSESLRRELIVYGVDVIVIAPGAIATPIWSKADAMDIGRFATTAYAPALAKLKTYMVANGENGLPPERIGETARIALTAARPRVRYTVTPNPVQNFLTLALPKRIVDGVIARRLGLRPSQD